MSSDYTKKVGKFAKGDSYMDSPDKIFQKFLEKIDPDGENLLKGAEKFSETSLKIQKAKDEYYQEIQKTPLVYIIWVWTNRDLRNNEFSHSVLKRMQDLLEEKIINYQGSNGGLITLGEYAKIGHSSILESIRCKRKWPVSKREMSVIIYIDFSEWLSKVTQGFIVKAEDPDRKRTAERALNFSAFVDFLDELDERYQCVAKLLFFGGDRTMDEVINIKIEDIDFQKGLISFDSHLVAYPIHVFEDLKAQIGDRTSGLVFIGRQNSPLNPATIFRNFKEAALKADLDPFFSPKLLTIDSPNNTLRMQ